MKTSALTALVMALIFAGLASCGVPASTIVDPASSTVKSRKIEKLPSETTTVKVPSGNEYTTVRDSGSVTVEEEAVGTGASLKAKGEKIVQDFRSEAPGASLGKDRAGATGGGTDSQIRIAGLTSAAKSPVFWIGVFCLLIGVGLLFVRPPQFPVPLVPVRTSIYLGIAGAGLIAAALFPVAFYIAVGIAVLAIVFPYIRREFAAAVDRQRAEEGEKAKRALRSVAAGIADFKLTARDPLDPTVPAPAWEKLKKYLESHIEDDERAVIDRIRKEDRLG